MIEKRVVRGKGREQEVAYLLAISFQGQLGSQEKKRFFFTNLKRGGRKTEKKTEDYQSWKGAVRRYCGGTGGGATTGPAVVLWEGQRWALRWYCGRGNDWPCGVAVGGATAG